MKLFRFGDSGKEKPGVLSGNLHLDVSEFGEDYNEEFFSTDGIQRLKEWLKSNEDRFREITPGSRFGSAVGRPSKIICIGLNYADHAKETNAQLPSEPIIFFKSTTAICGPNDDVVIPPGATKLDWEVELAVVIGKKAKHVSEESASDYIAGYILHNDYSERNYQLERGGQWVKGKSYDTFAPLGPYLVTPDEISDVNKLQLWLKVNGKTMQDGNTDQLIFKVPYLIHYLSCFTTLLPGDIISTGTPNGVGLGLKPPVFLRKGDVVELSIEGLGTSKQVVKEYSASIG